MAPDWGRESTQGSAASEVGDVFGGTAVYNYCPARLSPFRGYAHGERSPPWREIPKIPVLAAAVVGRPCLRAIQMFAYAART